MQGPGRNECKDVKEMNASNGMKIVGLKKAVGEFLSTPRGWHVEIWAYVKDGTIQVYTSDLLSDNSWTVGHDDDEIRLDNRDGVVYPVGNGMSWTQALRDEIDAVFGGE